MTRRDVPLDKAYRLLNHGPTVLVSAAADGHRNVMAAAWCMPLDFDPPKIVVVIDKATHTRTLIAGSGEFAINVPCRALLEQTVAVGNESGRDVDKFARHGLDTFAGTRIGAPLIGGCVAWLECRRVPEPHNETRYDLFIGEVLAAQADSRVFSDGRWHFDGEDDRLRTMHHVAGGAFFETGCAIGGQDRQG